MAELTISSAHDVEALARAFTADGALQVPDFLADGGAEALRQELAASGAWRLTANRGEQVVDFGPELLAKWGPDQWATLRKAVTAGGRYGFQFCYETIRLKDDAASTPLLSRFVELMNAPATLDLLRRVTGTADVGFADAHASRYRAGHFLTTHDDEVEGMGRRAAYVLNLSPEWRPDWGGLLLFHDRDGNVRRGFAPLFNSLNIFRVPQPHSVSWVTPLAAAPRYAVTGWLRAGTRPG